MRLSGAARLAGVIGWPVAHSRSPLMHGCWIETLGLDAAYVPLAVRPEHVEAAVRALPKLSFRGANVTIPHKEAALGLCDAVDDAARAIGAVNTLIFHDDGHVEGRNTDAPGFAANLRRHAPGLGLAGRPAAVLGAGGASRAVIFALAGLGASPIRLVNRSRAKADALAAALAPVARIEVVEWESRVDALAGARLLVNATSLGQAGQPPLAIDLAPLPADAAVADIVYVPLETPLLRAARARGLTAVPGLGMLIEQARPGFAAWFGVEPPVTDELVRRLEDDIRAKTGTL